MLTVRVQPIDADILVVVNDNLSPAAQSAALAAFARQTAKDADALNQKALGYLPPRKTFVDSVEGGSEDRVRPRGQVVYEYTLLLDVLAFIDQTLIEHSPVKSGRYSRSHELFADGNHVDPEGEIPPAAEYVFINAQPYARKVEKGESPQFPNGVYEATAALAASRFGNMAKVAFEYRPLPGGGDVADWAASPHAAKHARRHHRVSNPGEWLKRQPAIIVTATGQ